MVLIGGVVIQVLVPVCRFLLFMNIVIVSATINPSSGTTTIHQAGAGTSTATSSFSSAAPATPATKIQQQQQQQQTQTALLDSTTIKMNKIRSVAVVGGTHGNEYTGVFCVKALERKLLKGQRRETTRIPDDDSGDMTTNTTSSTTTADNNNNNNNKHTNYPFRVSTLIGNPIAFLQNKRFVQEDLNRQFTMTKMTETLKIKRRMEQEQKQQQQQSSSLLSVEQQRAIELDELLGPKFVDDTADTNDIETTKKKQKTDFIIDLHTTTSNMNTSLIIGQGDPLSTQCAAYVMNKMMMSSTPNSTKTNTKTKSNNNYTCRVMMHTHASSETRPNLSSIGEHSITIEVGPVPQGVLRHDKVEEMEYALDAVLEFLHRSQTEPAILLQELQAMYPDGIVPCFRSAPAIRKGEMSAKLVWPTFDDDQNEEDEDEKDDNEHDYDEGTHHTSRINIQNENFPKWIVHKDVQDRDFYPITTGDPLFVTIDGEVIPYDGSHGNSVLLMFINEGGYYYKSSGTGISVARNDTYDLLTGMILP